jgi:hypothetical protein
MTQALPGIAPPPPKPIEPAPSSLRYRAWAREVEELTKPYREKKAAALSQKARELRQEQAEHVAGVELANRYRAELAEARGVFPTLDAPVPSMVGVGLWHQQRARGARERFQRMQECQQVEAIDIKCERCGTAATRGARCRTALVCLSCRGKISFEKRAKLGVNRAAAIGLCHKRGLFLARREGRWSEKLVTLTAPHFAELDVVQRVELVRRAWGHFAPGLNRWLKLHPDASRFVDRQGNGLARWYRNLEWTTGDELTVERSFGDGSSYGHPHVHMWFLGPWLPGASAKDDPRDNVIRNLWRNALRLAAQHFPGLAKKIGPKRYRRWALSEPWEYREMRGLDAVCVDVRACKPGKESLREVIKYLFKDTAKHDRQLAPEIWASVYEAFDGSRTTQGSRGLMTLAAREHALTGFLEDPVTGEIRPVEVADLGHFRIGARCSNRKCCARGPWHVRRRRMTDEERHALDAKATLRKARPREQVPFYRDVGIS